MRLQRYEFCITYEQNVVKISGAILDSNISSFIKSVKIPFLSPFPPIPFCKFLPRPKKLFPQPGKNSRPAIPVAPLPINPLAPSLPINPILPSRAYNIIRCTSFLRFRPHSPFLCCRTYFSSFIPTVLCQKAHKIPKISRKSFGGSENSSTFASAFEREAPKKKRSLKDLHKTDK